MRKIVLIFSLFVASNMYGAPPTWIADVNSSSPYSMNVTTKVNVDCIDLTNPSNIIAAFVGGNLRGAAYTNQIVNGNYLAFLTVYSNIPSGETVTFKIYDSDADAEYVASTTVLFQDGSAFGFPATPFSVLTNYQPTNITLSDTTADENSLNVSVGKLTSADQDNASHTYSLVAGSGDIDNANFSIVGDSLYVSGTLNFETKSNYSIRIQTSDGVCTFQKKFLIKVADKNDTPTDLALSKYDINENSSINTSIALLTTTDEDAGDSYTYSLVAGAGDVDNALVAFSGANLLVKGAYNYEVKDTLYIRIRTTDAGGLFYDEAVKIIINDVNETPTDIVISKDTINENLAIGTTVIALSAIDEDLIESHSFSFDNSGTSDNGLFTIIGTNIKTNFVFNFEVKSLYTINVKVTDLGSNTYSRQFIIYIKDTNDIPTDIFMSDTTVLENATIGDFVGRFSTEDEDANDTYTYTFVSGIGGEDNGAFTISGDSLLTDTTFDFNAQSSYHIKIKTTDSTGISYTKTFIIAIIDVGQPPTDVLISDTVILENMPKGTLIADLSTIDPDVNDDHFYQLVVGNGDTDNGSFNISGNQLFSNAIFNYEVKNEYSIRIKTEESIGSGYNYQKVFIIKVLDVNEKPNIKDTTLYIDENVELGTLIGQFSISDIDSGDVLKTSILDDVNFTVIEAELITNSSIDYEAIDQYKLNVVVEDYEGLKDTALITVIVNDVVEFDKPLGVNRVLTPNDDGKNDFLWVTNVEIYADYSLKIFNSSGRILYEVQSNYNNSWDGKYNGVIVEQGVYYYLFQSNTDSELMFKGSITVIR